ncbi:MAG: hypothetical protein ACKV19_09535 [Verrucomicrobiales bacterium]
MDVHCSSCGEPWDTHHLLHDSIHDTSLDDTELNSWSRLLTAAKLTPAIRAAYAAAGWHFGRTLVHVIRCPACRPEDKPDPDRAQLKSTIEEILGDDIDSIGSEFTDHHL